MSTKRQNRKTKQVRILEENHRKLKLFAAERGTTISKVVDELLALGIEAKSAPFESQQKRVIKRHHKLTILAIRQLTNR